MTDSSSRITGLPDESATPPDSEDDLFAFMEKLRVSVKTTVGVEQRRGLSLAEIVVIVRGMVQLAEDGTRNTRAFPAHAFRAISRQAIAWCVESYNPLLAIPDVGAPSGETSPVLPLHILPHEAQKEAPISSDFKPKEGLP